MNSVSMGSDTLPAASVAVQTTAAGPTGIGLVNARTSMPVLLRMTSNDDSSSTAGGAKSVGGFHPPGALASMNSTLAGPRIVEYESGSGTGVEYRRRHIGLRANAPRSSAAGNVERHGRIAAGVRGLRIDLHPHPVARTGAARPRQCPTRGA